MATSTVYDVRLRMLLEDRASRGLKGVGGAAAQAARSSMDLGRALRVAAAMAGGFFGLSAGKKAFIDFNASMEQARITMAGMLQLNVGGVWEQNMTQATSLVSKLQERARKSVGTTKDMVDMASMLVRPLAAAGVSMENIEHVTAQAVIAARAFGLQSEFAARDIEQVLMGTVGTKDRFARAILEPLGHTMQQINAMTAQARADVLIQAMNQPAITRMAEAQEVSWSGVASTFIDNLQMGLGRVGLPMFQAITAEVQRWNKWLEANQTTVDRFIASWGQAVHSLFTLAKEVTTFVVENRDTLLAVAAGFAVFKGVHLASGAVLAMGNVARNLQAMHTALSGAGGLAMSFASATTAVGLLAGAATGLYLWWRGEKKKEERRNVDRAAVMKELGDRARQNREHAGIAPGYLSLLAGKGDRDAALRLEQYRWERDQRKERDPELVKRLYEKEMIGIGDKGFYVPDSMRDKLGTGGAYGALLNAVEDLNKSYNATERRRMLEEENQSIPTTAAPMSTRPKMEVNIARIEVVSDDPDRFAFGLGEAFADLRRNPASAIGAFPRRM